MAQYSHLQIYKTSYDLLLKIMIATKNYPREYKYSLGERLQNYMTDLIIIIYKTNNSLEKVHYLTDIITQIQYINLYLRISYDLKLITLEKYTEYTQMSTSISKQAQGWKFACEKQESIRA